MKYQVLFYLNNNEKVFKTVSSAAIWRLEEFKSVVPEN